MSTRTRRTPAPPRNRGSLALISHLAQVVRRDADQALADVDGMRPRHLIALTLLRDHGPMAQAALAEGLRLDPSNVVALLNDLESRGLVTRRRDPEDRRRHIVELSEGGVGALDRAEAGLAAVEDRLFGALSGDERRTLHELLLRASGDRLPDCAEAAEVDEEGPVC
ncbi:MAG: MarR family winged helix-turn-helix transcriptional regulator [Thermoleophilia bacterium]